MEQRFGGTAGWIGRRCAKNYAPPARRYESVQRGRKEDEKGVGEERCKEKGRSDERWLIMYEVELCGGTGMDEPVHVIPRALR